MTDYYIPLSEITGSLGLGNLPAVGEDFRKLLQSIGVRSWNESWNDTDSVVRGTGVFGEGEFVQDCGAFQLALGDPSNGTTEFDFELVRDRSTLLDTALALVGEVDDPSTLSEKQTVFFRSDGLPHYARLVIRGMGLRLRFDRDKVRKGKLVIDADGKKSIEPLESGDDTADILLLPPVIIFDTRLPFGFDIEMSDDQLIEVPPLRFMSGDEDEALFSLLIKKVKIDLSESSGFREALDRGYDETWKGVYFEELAVLGLDDVFPLLPSTIDATNWFIGTDGITGAISVSLAGGVWLYKDLTFELELEKDRLVKAGGQLTVMVSTLGRDNEFASLGPDGDLLFGFSMRFNPDGGTLLEGVLRTPHPSNPNNDIGLFTLKDRLADVFPGMLFILGLSAGLSPTASLAAWLLQMFTFWGVFDFKAITLDAIAVRRRPQLLAGRKLYWIDFVLDVRIRVGLNIPLGIVGLNIKTKPDHPPTLLCKGLTFAVAINLDDFTEQELGDIDRFDMFPDSSAAISFEVGDQAIIDDSPLALVKAGVGRWDQGIWVDLGFKVQKKYDDWSFSVIPSMVRIWLLADMSVDHVSFLGASFSLLVPQVIYARGEWSSGEVTRASGKAMILGWSGAAAHPEEPKNWMLVAGFGMQESDLPPPPEPKVATSRLVWFELECSSGIPLLGATSLYGISGLQAQNARPAIGAGTPAQWLTQRPPKYQVGVDKWEPALDASGFAAGIVLGSSSDQGRPWNLKAGFMYTNPGPVLMLFGTANWLKERKGVKETEPAALTFNAVLDLGRKEFLFGIRYEKKVPDGSGRILKLSIPGEIFISGHGWHIYLGQDKPADRFISAELFSKYKIAGYIMLDTETITNIAETGIDVPGVSLAIGVRFQQEGGRKGGRYKLYYYFKASVDFAASFTSPRLTLLRALVAGGLVAKAWGIGFEFEVSAEFMWVRPTPDFLKGTIKVTIDLPWPIPNLSLKIDHTSGADGEGEALTGSLVDGLSLFLTASQSVVEVTGPVADVPLNPIFGLAFKYPTRNNAGVPGSFNLSGGNASTFYFVGGETGGERGYAVSLFELSLLKVVNNVATLLPGPFPALWRPSPVTAAGGLADNRILELFAYEGITASRYIGASADYVDWALEGFDPCPPAEPPRPICYGFDGEVPGPIHSPRRVPASDPATDTRRVTISSVPEDPEAELIRRYFGAIAHRAEIVPSPIPGLAVRVIRLPSNDGTDMPFAAADHLQMEFAKAAEAEVTILRYPNASVTIKGWFGDQLVDVVDSGELLGHIGEDKFEIRLYRVKGPINRMTFETSHSSKSVRAQSLVVKVCLLYSADLEQYDDQVILGQSWSDFWSDLLDQEATTSSAMLLEPGTQYRLDVKTSWAHRHEDGSLGSAHPTNSSFNFATTSEPPKALRGPAAQLDNSDWEVRTIPAKDETNVYTERPIRLEFRDARTDKVFAAFGKRVVLRLTDSAGADLFDRLELLKENAKDLPEYQQSWHDHMVELPCVPPDLDSLWSMGSAHFDTVLAAGERYDGTIVMIPSSITDLTTVEDWEQYPVLYSFPFTTSRFASLADHVEEHRIFDEVTAATAEALAAARTAIGPILPGNHRTDGTVLQAVLEEHLHLIPRQTPADPEVVRIWQAAGSGSLMTFALVGLLFDGPEPLMKIGSDALAVGRAGVPVPLKRLDGEDHSRILLLFDGPAAAGDLAVAVNTSFVDAAGQTQPDTASLPVPVPALPPVLAAEPAP